MGKTVRRIVLAAWLAVSVVLVVLLAGIVLSHPEIDTKPSAGLPTYEDKRGDQELAYLLVKLELRTRAVIGGHYTRAQSVIPGVGFIYKRWIAKNTILPAAVADRVFSEVVPGATGGRAWVKMVVKNPRNPHNRGDAIALELLRMIQSENATAERSTPEAYYYAEPIKATSTCLPCHGESRGEPDPLFPQYKKNGWREGEIVGAVIARVAPEQ